MEEYNLDFCFKGLRTYVHGTDIFNKSYELLKDNIKDNKIDFSFHGIAKRNINLVEQKPENEELLKFVVKFTNKEDQRKVLYGVENEKSINCRYEYLEEEICKISKLTLDNQHVILDKDSSYSFVENTVALNKYLLENLFTDANGKWYFTRFQLSTVPQEKYPLKLKLKANFNFKLTKTEVFVADISVGFIYFSLV